MLKALLKESGIKTDSLGSATCSNPPRLGTKRENTEEASDMMWRIGPVKMQ